MIYFEIRGVSIIKHPKRLFSLLCVTGFEEFTGGLAPAWIIDIWYIWSSSNQEESAEAEKKKLSSQSINGEEGIRRPNNQIRSVNTKEGVRPPRIHSPMSKK